MNDKIPDAADIIYWTQKIFEVDEITAIQWLDQAILQGELEALLYELGY
ncbi:hypothetical protein GS597_09175 [Synechococcales cyanobacterium C]|uniref:Uncharacterized protein n=1 Tax=Petrachloros mirabilis ULC683 TaxID=2781853 RepID=A0A8K1ZWX7_9CYAN|nr:hypothetical protein [Petrachloros mirabilis]NCJ06674.1 hypothetical protein [Petrachloros mirabilis ULC683]